LPKRFESALIVRSFAKINLALAVLGKRPDGFHEIRTVFQSIDLHDRIEIRASSRLDLDCADLAGVPVESNLVWKAAQALSGLVPSRPGAHITLRKRIPAGAGLGGGSSNAAATLLGLVRFWGVKLAPGDLQTLAAGLGSDVPFFLGGGTALGAGRGDEISTLPDLPPTNVAVVFPGIHVSTSEAYGSLRLSLTSQDGVSKMQRFCGGLRSEPDCLPRIFNDFEASILPAYPVIAEAKEFLTSRGATAAMLSGSGSSVFGFFLNEESTLAVSRAARPEAWQVFPAKTLSRADYLQRLLG
jgi:4-diphosphocytidyl-2-C-methyl-D-erythritol kinase